MAAKKLDGDDVVFPNVQLQNLGGASAIVVGAFCEHNDQVHSLMNLLAAKAGPGAETEEETGLDNKSAVAFEKHRMHRSGCGWRREHGAITTNLFTRACPSSTPAPPTPLSKRTCGALTNAKSTRRATSYSPSPPVRQGWGAGTATHGAGGLPQGISCFLGKPWLRPRDPKEAEQTTDRSRFLWPLKLLRL
jgi:hypothetical protein